MGRQTDRLVYLRAITTGEVPALRSLKFLQISHYAASLETGSNKQPQALTMSVHHTVFSTSIHPSPKAFL